MGLAEDGGPYFSAAIFCERVHTETNGRTSIIGTPQGLYVPPAQRRQIHAGQPWVLPVTLAIHLNAGKAVGTHMIELIPGGPVGDLLYSLDDLTVTFRKEWEHKALDVACEISILRPGQLWVDVLLNGVVRARPVLWFRF